MSLKFVNGVRCRGERTRTNPRPAGRLLREIADRVLFQHGSRERAAAPGGTQKCKGSFRPDYSCARIVSWTC
jgi:hypothetical protein